jgi:hypothetical protein
MIAALINRGLALFGEAQIPDQLAARGIAQRSIVIATRRRVGEYFSLPEEKAESRPPFVALMFTAAIPARSNCRR